MQGEGSGLMGLVGTPEAQLMPRAALQGCHCLQKSFQMFVRLFWSSWHLWLSAHGGWMVGQMLSSIFSAGQCLQEGMLSWDWEDREVSG